MRKNVIRINENTLKRIISESVKRILKEQAGYDRVEDIIGEYHEVVAMGEGFDLGEIAEGFRKAYEGQMSQGSGSNYAWFDYKINPGKLGVSTIDVTPDGEPDDLGRKTNSFEEAAVKLRNVLTTQCTPRSMQSHVIGWIITSSIYRPAIFPLLDDEGVMIYLEARDGLNRAMSDFYSGSGYRGD